MNEQPEKRRSSISIALNVTAILLLYVLSTGPVFRIYTMTGLAYDHPVAVTLMSFYYPVLLLCESSDAINSVVSWYLDLWFF